MKIGLKSCSTGKVESPCSRMTITTRRKKEQYTEETGPALPERSGLTTPKIYI